MIKIKYYLIFVMLVLIYVEAVCQEAGKYDRPSITTIYRVADYTPYAGRVAQHFKNNVYPEKFNNLNVNTQKNIDTTPDYSLRREIIAKWFNRKANGTFDLTFIQQMGLYNASDNEVKESDAMKRGRAAIEDAGEKLINKNFIIICEFYNLENIIQSYDRQDSIIEVKNRLIAERNRKAELYNRNLRAGMQPAPYEKFLERVKRTSEGYIGKVNIYLYKLSWNEEVSNYFYNELWMDTLYLDSELRKRKFEQYIFPLEKVSNYKSINISGLQEKENKTGMRYSDEQLFGNMIKMGFNIGFNSLNRAEKEEFAVSTGLYSVKPMSAKIGVKEGVKTDQRFFVYEYVLKGSKKELVRKGVIRAGSKVTDNRQNASGNTVPTPFYQVAGKKLDKGMLMKEKDDIGLGLILWGGQSLGGLTLEFGLGSLTKKAGRKFFMELYFSSSVANDYTKFLAQKTGNAEQWFTSRGFTNNLHTNITGFDFGFSRDLNFMRNLVISPLFALGFERNRIIDSTALIYSTATDAFGKTVYNYKNFKDSTVYGTTVLNGGLRLGFNLRYNIQLMYSCIYKFRINRLGNGIKTEDYLPADIKKSSGMMQSIGIRFQF